MYMNMEKLLTWVILSLYITSTLNHISYTIFKSSWGDWWSMRFILIDFWIYISSINFYCSLNKNTFKFIFFKDFLDGFKYIYKKTLETLKTVKEKHINCFFLFKYIIKCTRSNIMCIQRRGGNARCQPS
jgi:hypothetical protein